MKKTVIGIVAAMMVFGTTTALADNAIQDDRYYHDNDFAYGHRHNDHPRHRYKEMKRHRRDYHMGRHHRQDRLYGDRRRHSDIWYGPTGRKYINVRHCMYGYRAVAPPHRHVYAFEVVRGHATGHLICTRCGRHTR